jgi:predicted RNA polymerase sigma factor
MADGPAAGLAILDGLELPGYPHLPAARGELLERLGRAEEARREFARAAELTRNATERQLFARRATGRTTP